MGMDPNSGDFRELMSAMDAKPSEVVFSTGEVVRFKGCYFRIETIFNGGMSLKSISKEEGLKHEVASLKKPPIP